MAINYGLFLLYLSWYSWINAYLIELKKKQIMVENKEKEKRKALNNSISILK